MQKKATASESLVSLSTWLQRIGVTPCTAWRWRRKGWLRTVNICGRQYVTAEAIREFCERAERGDFAKEHTVPRREMSRALDVHRTHRKARL